VGSWFSTVPILAKHRDLSIDQLLKDWDQRVRDGASSMLSLVWWHAQRLERSPPPISLRALFNVCMLKARAGLSQEMQALSDDELLSRSEFHPQWQRWLSYSAWEKQAEIRKSLVLHLPSDFRKRELRRLEAHRMPRAGRWLGVIPAARHLQLENLEARDYFCFYFGVPPLPVRADSFVPVSNISECPPIHCWLTNAKGKQCEEDFRGLFDHPFSCKTRGRVVEHNALRNALRNEIATLGFAVDPRESWEESLAHTGPGARGHSDAHLDIRIEDLGEGAAVVDVKYTSVTAAGAMKRGSVLAHVNQEERIKFGDHRSRYRITDSDGRHTTQLHTFAAIFTTFGGWSKGAMKLVRTLGAESGRSTQRLVDRIAILIARIGARRLRASIGPRSSSFSQSQSQ